MGFGLLCITIASFVIKENLTLIVFDVWVGQSFARRWYRRSGLRDRPTEGQILLLFQLFHALAFILPHLFFPADVDLLPVPCGSRDQCDTVCVPHPVCKEWI